MIFGLYMQILTSYLQAFVSYMRSIFLQKDKSIFKIDELPAERFAESLGLPGAPKIKFLSKELMKKRKNASHVIEAAQQEAGMESDSDDTANSGEGSGNESESEHERNEKEEEKEKVEPVAAVSKKGVRTKYDRMFERKNQNILSDHYTKLVDHSADNAENEDDFITLKRADHELPEALPKSHTLSKRKQKMGQSKKAMLKLHGHGEKLLFDENGNARRVYEMRDAEKEFQGQDVLGVGREFAEGERGKLKDADLRDKAEAKERRKEKKRKRKEREKEVCTFLSIHTSCLNLAVRVGRTAWLFCSPKRILMTDTSRRILNLDLQNLSPTDLRRSQSTSRSLKEGKVVSAMMLWMKKRSWHYGCLNVDRK